MSPRKNLVHNVARPKIKNDPQALGMVRPTSFYGYSLKKILPRGFHILVTQKNNFCHPEGPQWGPGGLLARFRAKMPIFGQICKKFKVF